MVNYSPIAEMDGGLPSHRRGVRSPLDPGPLGTTHDPVWHNHIVMTQRRGGFLPAPFLPPSSFLLCTASLTSKESQFISAQLGEITEISEQV